MAPGGGFCSLFRDAQYVMALLSCLRGAAKACCLSAVRWLLQRNWLSDKACATFPALFFDRCLQCITEGRLCCRLMPSAALWLENSRGAAGSQLAACNTLAFQSSTRLSALNCRTTGPEIRAR